MDKDTQVSLHCSKVGRADKMIKSGRFENLYREFAAEPSSTQLFALEFDSSKYL
jgi:hypothetical protein